MPFARSGFISKRKKKKNNAQDALDLLTDADLQAQTIIAEGLRKRFPSAGLVGEENLMIPTRNGVVFTIDPLDGTKAFVRRESGHVAVMIGVLFEGHVVSAFIGDVWTREIFYFRPTSPNTHRLIDFDYPVPLEPYEQKLDSGSAILFREDPYNIPGFDFPAIRDKFTRYFIDSGSLGITFTKLLKGEAHAVFLHMTYYTPWDFVPIIGLTQQLGYRFHILDNGAFKPHQPALRHEPYDIDARLLICHPTLLSGLI